MDEMWTNLQERKQSPQEYLHGTSQRESIVMATSTLPSQSLLPIKFASLSPTLRGEKHWNWIWFLSPTLTRHSWISLIEGTDPFPCFNTIQDITVWRVLLLGANIIIQVNFLFINAIAAPVPTAPASIISSVTEIMIVIIFAAHQGHLQDFFFYQPQLVQCTVYIFEKQGVAHLISALWHCCQFVHFL